MVDKTAGADKTARRNSTSTSVRSAAANQDEKRERNEEEACYGTIKHKHQPAAVEFNQKAENNNVLGRLGLIFYYNMGDQIITEPPATRALAADPTLLQEWNRTASPRTPGVVPVAPAVVLPESSSELLSAEDSDKPRSSYPVATFVSNLVRSGIDSITAYAVDYEPTSIRSDSVVRAVAESETIRSAQADSNIPTLEGSDFVIVDGDLVAIPAPPPNQEEQEALEAISRSESRRTERHNRFVRRMRGIRKWVKKRTYRAVTSSSDKKTKDESVATPASGPASPTRQTGRPRKRSWIQPARDEKGESGVCEQPEDRITQDYSVSEPQRPLTTPSLQQHVLSRDVPAASQTAAAASMAAIPSYLPSDLYPRTGLAMGEPISVASAGSAVNADFIGNVEQVLECGLLADVTSAVAFIESDPKDDYWYYGKKDDKVKQDEMVLDNMLQLARHETSSDEDEIDLEEEADHPYFKKPAGAKEDADSKPLSEATTQDKHVWNDALKVVMVGSELENKSILARALAGKKPKPTKHVLGVDVHTWAPDLKFSIWDIHDLHPATQSLFLSPRSLYVLLWDLAVSNGKTVSFPDRTFTEDFDVNNNDEDEDDDEEDDFVREQLTRSADRALELDIQDRVLSWLDTIAYSGSAILPVVTVSDFGLDSQEIQRRCSMLQIMLMRHPAFEGEGASHLILGNNDSVLRVSLETGEGLPELQEVIHAIGKEHVFPHVGAPVHPVVVEVNQTVRRLKEDHKVILLDHLMSEMKSRNLFVEEVQEALYYLSSIGELLYYGNSTDEILSRYIILSRKWLVSALSCILRPDLQRELDETRRFMNLQCVYSGESFCESDVVQTLLQGTNSSCPILSARDSAMLWQSMSFMREAADRTAQLSSASNSMYTFLERLLVHTGIFLPLMVSSEPTYFVPSLLDSAASSGVWTYKSSESWMTSLCHSWLLRDGAPSNIMEHVTAGLIQDLYEFSSTFHGAIVKPLHHTKTYPMAINSMNEFMDTHNQEAIGRIRIHQIHCWKTCMLVKIGSVFAESGQNDLRESFSEVFVALVDEQSECCVATRDMSNSMKRLIVCGKGQVGHHGRKLWKGGLQLVLDSIRASLADATGCRREVVCPECLAHSHPSVAGTWSWDAVIKANETGNAGIRCKRGHLVDTNLLCGLNNVAPKPPPDVISQPRIHKSVSKLLRGTIVVGLWDSHAQEIRSVGSGFLVDKKLGLVVTAGHILFDMTEGKRFGTPYFGLKHARAVLGVIPDSQKAHKAVFRYFAELVAHDIGSVDACILRLTTRLERDVDGENCAGLAESPITNMKKENIHHLKMTRTFELEESVRILGFNQGGEGVLEQGKHVNRLADFAKGYICKRFTNMGSDDSSTSSQGSSKSLGDLPSRKTDERLMRGSATSFVPREEIVVMCPTISGHSGGPCVNDEGRVVGILSRADPVDRQRCYLVPSAEIKALVNKAKANLKHVQL